MNAINGLQEKIKDWWMPVFTGSVLVIIALLMIFYPLQSFIGLAVLFGWGLFAQGGFNFIFAMRSRRFFKGWIWYLMFGLIEMSLGAYLLFQPQLAAEAVVLYLGFWLTYVGISRISFSFLMKDMGIKNWWWSILGGFITLLIAYFIILNPVIGMFTVTFLVAFGIFVVGLMAISFGMEIKKINKLIL